jgi:single-strand DNA-binding protein
MSSVNKVILIGRLGKDPVTRFMPNGDAVCNFSVATSESWKDKSSGEKIENVQWHNIATYRKLAEICGDYLIKGSQVYLEGKLQTRKWKDKDGVEKYTTEVIADQMTMLGDKQSAGNAPPASRPSIDTNPKTPDSFADMDDDIPF